MHVRDSDDGESIVRRKTGVEPVGMGAGQGGQARPDCGPGANRTAKKRPVALAPSRLHTGPRVRITAPGNVETVLTDDAASRTLRDYFLAYNPRLPHEHPLHF